MFILKVTQHSDIQPKDRTIDGHCTHTIEIPRQWHALPWQRHVNEGSGFSVGAGWALVARRLSHKISEDYPSNPRRQVIPTQRGAKRVNEERVFIAAEVGFSGALTFAVIL